MAQVIVERPRLKPRNHRKGRQQRDADDLPCHEGMRRAHAWRGDCKQLNENLAPLRRYLASQVGRPWDKVYSEIAAHLRIDSTVQQHVRDHLQDFVAITPRRNITSYLQCRYDGLWRQRYYVNARTGLLCRTADLPEEKARWRAQRYQPAHKPDCIPLGPEREFRRLDGFWFEVRLAPLPAPVYRGARETVKRPLAPWLGTSRQFEAEMEIRRLISPPVFDVVTRSWIAVGPPIDTPDSWRSYRRSQPATTYAAAKRSLSKKELRRAGL